MSQNKFADSYITIHVEILSKSNNNENDNDDDVGEHTSIFLLERSFSCLIPRSRSRLEARPLGPGSLGIGLVPLLETAASGYQMKKDINLESGESVLLNIKTKLFLTKD